ncbi:type II toxin-antitoxin system PemK/MazF family toxin [Nakamurella sp. YIM 132087]|uniref:mRNA interferase n=1 Tax=Nakamurella alba TaxID=2665158 RepID=A0A7K1FRU8_9ACTN|nr:type II toxin-antitoxin system PemK/MazF family toxin [Nakamurella alba]MTD16872.1 type II toxin-antitoxin system PemK/MazF family toxin [Nakamurella alba]
MRRGDIVRADLEPTRGSEANKTRPVVIVSDDALNTASVRLGRGMITVVPLTSNISNVLLHQTVLPADDETGLTAPSKTQPEQIRSIDIQRMGPVLGSLTSEQLHQLNWALVGLLALDLYIDD